MNGFRFFVKDHPEFVNTAETNGVGRLRITWDSGLMAKLNLNSNDNQSYIGAEAVERWINEGYWVVVPSNPLPQSAKQLEAAFKALETGFRELAEVFKQLQRETA